MNLYFGCIVYQQTSFDFVRGLFCYGGDVHREQLLSKNLAETGRRKIFYICLGKKSSLLS